MLGKILDIRKKVKENSPLIHAITNPISINACANFVLSAGGKPMMAEHPDEVCEITKAANALALNIANITDARMVSIASAAQTAQDNNILSIIDAVGVTCSTLRLDYINKLLGKTHISAIKGNIAEIKALIGIKTETIGIDIKDKTENIRENIAAVKQLAEKYRCVAMSSGSTDIISDGKKTALVKNGRPEMSLVTGTGCILNVLAATYMSVSDAFSGCVAAAVILGLCGEFADCSKGMANYANSMLDELYLLTDEEIKNNIKLTVI